ncbi:MAG: aminopeptidase P family protein [Bacteroidales bacterium]
MKKAGRIVFLLLWIAGCGNSATGPESIPVSIDPSDLQPDEQQQEIHEARRERLLSLLDEGTVILGSSGQKSYNRHEFRPNNYFFYLTGLSLPGTYAILTGQGEDPYTLVLPEPTIRTMIYEGELPSEEHIDTLYRPDRILEYLDFTELVKTIFDSGRPVYLDRSDRLMSDRLGRMAGVEGDADLRHIGELVDPMRVIKESNEVQRLQKACNITALALARVMEACAPGQYEFEMESVIEGTFREYGAAMPGFASIVGSGPNSTILHYEHNTRRMEDGDLLLMDVGAEYGCYTADITRTIPVSGTFTDLQKTIYQLVLDAQKKAIRQMKPGNMFMDGHMAAKEVILDGLMELGLMTDRSAPWQVKFYILYPASHYLGMDVHDVGEMGGSFASFMQQTPADSIISRVLEPGMVLTIEPGLYFREKGLDQIDEIFGSEADSTGLAAFVEQVRPVYGQYAGIGVRIEDDILITPGGNMNLSRFAPKEIPEIEQIMQR